MPEVFVVEDDPVMGRLLISVLRQAGLTPTLFTTGAAVLAALEDHAPEALCLDLVLPDASGETVLVKLREHHPDLPVIVLSAQEDVGRAVEIMKLRPFDYLVKPISPERLVHSMTLARQDHELRRRVRQLEREVQDTFRFEEIVGQSPRMGRVYDQIDKVLNNRVPVFIHGDSGTGKELVARAIHYHGARRSGPFVALNCGAIAESLQESELFGHERGAFTGAASQFRGRFEQANGGTLFLDEVGELSPAVQTRLLRVLQEHHVQRLGGTQTVAVDVRIISATHRNLETLIREGSFREDLYYRLMVFPIDMPPLHERPEDIPALTMHFVRKHTKMLGCQAATFDSDALDVLCRYKWPGNVRELENVVVRTLVSSGGGVIGVDALPPALVLQSMHLEAPAEATASAGPATDRATTPGAIVTLKEMERQAITHALTALDGNMSLVARRLGLGRATLYRKLAQFGITPPS